MAEVQVYASGGRALCYDTDHVEHATASTPADVHEAGATDAGWAERELGQRHLHLDITFKQGTSSPYWK